MEHQIEQLKRQARADYNDIMLALSVQRDAFSASLAAQGEAIAAALAAMQRALDQTREDMNRAHDAQAEALTTFARKTEQRFQKLTRIVKSSDDRTTSLEHRVDAIEKRLSA